MRKISNELFGVHNLKKLYQRQTKNMKNKMKNFDIFMMQHAQNLSNKQFICHHEITKKQVNHFLLSYYIFQNRRIK